MFAKPSRPDLAIPMPDRGNRLFSGDGETIDPTQTYYANLIASGDLIEVKADADTKSKKG